MKKLGKKIYSTIETLEAYCDCSCDCICYSAEELKRDAGVGASHSKVETYNP